jgi:hypothetical protein
MASHYTATLPKEDEDVTIPLNEAGMLSSLTCKKCGNPGQAQCDCIPDTPPKLKKERKHRKSKKKWFTPYKEYWPVAMCNVVIDCPYPQSPLEVVLTITSPDNRLRSQWLYFPEVMCENYKLYAQMHCSYTELGVLNMKFTGFKDKAAVLKFVDHIKSMKPVKTETKVEPKATPPPVVPEPKKEDISVVGVLRKEFPKHDFLYEQTLEDLKNLKLEGLTRDQLEEEFLGCELAAAAYETADKVPDYWKVKTELVIKRLARLEKEVKHTEAMDWSKIWSNEISRLDDLEKEDMSVATLEEHLKTCNLVLDPFLADELVPPTYWVQKKAIIIKKLGELAKSKVKDVLLGLSKEWEILDEPTSS